MAILQACSVCRTRHSLKSKVCKKCGQKFETSKRSGSVIYWVAYRLNKKQIFKNVGNCLDDAKIEEGTIKRQKKEGIITDSYRNKITFNELSKWYLELEKVKALKSYWLIQLTIKKFNTVFSDKMVNTLRPADLENYQIQRQKEGKSPATIDHEIQKPQAMIQKAVDNGIINPGVIQVFKKVNKMLKKGSDVRNRILSRDEFNRLMDNSPPYLKPIIATGYYSGMRTSEILNLTWDKIDLKNRIINLEASDTKDNEFRIIPICESLAIILGKIIRAVHTPNVFLYQNKPIKKITKALSSACKKAEITYGRFSSSGFVFHDLRHTFNTNCRKAGIQESVIMNITGHSTREMFDRYNTIDREDGQNAVDKLDKFLMVDFDNCCKKVAN
jgi:integrase